jgi:hypothetical protein
VPGGQEVPSSNLGSPTTLTRGYAPLVGLIFRVSTNRTNGHQRAPTGTNGRRQGSNVGFAHRQLEHSARRHEPDGRRLTSRYTKRLSVPAACSALTAASSATVDRPATGPNAAHSRQ